MLHLVSEQYGFSTEGMEYGLLSPERIEQLEREDLDRYHRSILKVSSYCDSMDEESHSKANEDADLDQDTINEVMLQFCDETKSEMAEMKAELSVIISILQDTSYTQAATPILPIQAANEIDALAGPFPTELQGNYIYCDSVEEESNENPKVTIVTTYAHNMFTKLPRPVPIELNEDNDCVFLSEMDDQRNACKVFAEMPEPIIEENMVSIEIPKAAHYLLDERHMISPVASQEDSYDLSYKGDVLGFSETNSPSLAKMRFNPQVFDPGTLAFKQEDYKSHLNANESELHCIDSVLFQVVSSHQNDANLHHDLDYFQESETTDVSIDDAVLVENAVPSSEELLDFEDYVCHEETIKDSLIDDVRKINEILVSEGIMSCEITVQSSFSEVSEQNGKNDDSWYALNYLCITNA